MDIVFSYSIETEATKLLITLKLVAKEFYLKNGFYVLPSVLDPKLHKRTIILPELDYLGLAGNWKRYIPRITPWGENEFDPELRSLLLDILNTQLPQLTEYDQLNAFEQTIKPILEPALKRAAKSIPYLEGKQITFAVHPTHIGSCGSFAFHDFIHTPKNDITLDLYLRVDQPPQAILELAASALTRGVMEPNGNNSWRDTEAVSDFFAKYILGAGSDHFGTIDSLAGIDPHALNQSISYVCKLKAPTGEIIRLDTETNRIYVIGQHISHIFSPIEHAFITALLQHPNQCLTFDQLTDAMYHTDSDTKYSLWGIRKAAQRVRQKLAPYGIPPELIESVKGEGFRIKQ